MEKHPVIITIVSCMMFFSCNKDKFLSAKPDSFLVVPSTLEDCERILDDDRTMNGENGKGLYPSVHWIQSDEVVLDDVLMPYLTVDDLAQYSFEKDPFVTGTCKDWDTPYRIVFYSNMVLDLLKKITPAPMDQEKYDAIKGNALFHRAFMYYALLQVFAKPFEQSSATDDPGIVLRVSSDINEKIGRVTVNECYQLIASDLGLALKLLPVVPEFKTRGSKTAVYALLARMNLSMRNYQMAGKYADSSLLLNGDLIDFNSVTGMTRFNDEVVFHSILSWSIFRSAGINPELKDLYLDGDLRIGSLWFDESERGTLFKGGYSGSASSFAGLANDEVYLIRAECRVRSGNIEGALEDLNTLLFKRYQVGKFSGISEADPVKLLDIILQERRKELVYRGTRSEDIRRLNLEGRGISVSHYVNGVSKVLPPNSLLSIYPIPQSVIGFHPDMIQNER
ncbi:RagB/SusD family nutrient uptake outer membrane protein [Flavihumibacter petaseus]|uniref:Uncharacterized protein n=1 Tax=Flavihumibacter petaseus NBRC 106054 TaxID=1220578 RepID=A0A0E9N7C4_9BACT|nr:RagB/SusD family nutrient uptake outer membrane protein [Flavihumibacter petaseus]GAO45250.1 hypothetical protein FPE01S_04_04930 [Flavihumibacter petaseus NBRC 106054]